MTTPKFFNVGNAGADALGEHTAAPILPPWAVILAACHPHPIE